MNPTLKRKIIETPKTLSELASEIIFTNPSVYKHWQLIIENTKAFLIMKVDEDEGFFDGYKLFEK